MEKQKLLEIRDRIKKKYKPNFIRQDAHKKKKLEAVWRRPRGMHSKLRLRRKGHIKAVSPGYGSPVKVKGLDRSGLEMVLVCNTNLDKINPKTQGIIISGSVGTRKKIDIIKAAQEKGIHILNIKDAGSFIKSANEAVAKRKEIRAAKGRKKEETAKKMKKEEKKEHGKGIEKAISEEEDIKKKEEDKKEKDKVLTKRT